MTGYEFAAIVVSIVAVIATLLGIIQNVSSTTTANQIAGEANATALKALEIAKLGIKKEMLPEFEFEYFNNQEGFRFCIIRNTSHGSAKILEFATSTVEYCDMNGKKPETPFHLRYNEQQVFQIKTTDRMPELNERMKEKAILHSLPTMIFENDLGHKYAHSFVYDDNENQFRGHIVEQKASG